MARFVNYGIYGDGDLYESDANVALGYVARLETLSNYVAMRIHYVSQIIAGNIESFRVLRLSFDTSLQRPSAFRYEAFIDKVEATDQISAIIRHSGSEFVVQTVSLATKMKRSKGKDV